LFGPEDKTNGLLKILSELETGLEEKEARDREVALIFSENFKRVYETAIAHLFEYYGLEIKVDGSTLALTTEGPCLVSE